MILKVSLLVLMMLKHRYDNSETARRVTQKQQRASTFTIRPHRRLVIIGTLVDIK